MSRNKYNARKATIDGRTFDSQMEADYYLYLKDKKEQVRIKDIKFQPKFVLQEAFEKNGKRHRKIEYVADFEVIEHSGESIIIDVKGMLTPVFRIKEKLFEKKYPNTLVLVTRCPKKYGGGWIDYYELQRLRRQDKRKRNKKKKNKKKS